MRPWVIKKSSNRMDPTLPPQLALGRQRRPRLIAGLALSLLVHAVALLAWHPHQPAQRPADAPASISIAVWLRAPPVPKAAPVRVSAPSAAKPKPSTAARSKSRRAPPDLIALPAPSPAAPARPDAFTVEAPSAPSAPRFDLEAARKTARALANEPDPARAGTAVAQLPPRPLETETRAARAISRASRRDCKDGIPGGLLAPLILMFDKKDSGCKW